MAAIGPDSADFKWNSILSLNFDDIEPHPVTWLYKLAFKFRSRPGADYKTVGFIKPSTREDIDRVDAMNAHNCHKNCLKE